MSKDNYAFEVEEINPSADIKKSSNKVDQIPPKYDNMYGASSSNGSSSSSSSVSADFETSSAPPVRLTWSNVGVVAPGSKALFSRTASPDKTILKDISGYAEPGSLLAIMGSSGAGKSTLLNILTNRNTGGLKINGQILANGVDVGNSISNISAYVQQNDIFMGELTVKEHLTFTARLRMDKSYSEQDKSQRIQEVMRQMGLKKIEGTKIGSAGAASSISGGEMKRLSVASEILTKPSIIFLDEPTSGLDSYLAKIIIECLQGVAKTGCTVLCTIHQPSSEVFDLFDRLLLLSMGQTVYHGDTTSALSFYERMGFPCPRNYNPADHYIMKISVVPGNEDQSKKSIQNFVSSFQSSDVAKGNEKVISSSEDNPDKSIIASMNKGGLTYNVGFWEQFYACFIRALKVSNRNPVQNQVRIAQTVFGAILIGLIYLRTPFGKQVDSSDVTTITGALFLVITNLTFTTVISVLNAFPAEIPIFRREHFNGMYSTLSYFMSKNLAELPSYIYTPFLFAVIVYFMFGLNPGVANFFLFFAFITMMCNTCVSFGYMVSAASPSVTVALGAGPALMMPFLLLGGFFIQVDKVPVYLFWIKYLSWFYYTNELLNINQWADLGDLSCNGATNGTGAGNFICFPNGQSVISFYGYNESNYGLDIGLMFAILLAYRVLALLFLFWRVRPSTR